MRSLTCRSPPGYFPRGHPRCHRCVRRQEWSSCLRDGPI